MIAAVRRRRRSPSSRLGRNEDPAFTIRTMVVAAGWPGATLDETLLQVTERLERKLQETRRPRRPAQLHRRRRDDDLRRPATAPPRPPRCRTSGTRCARTSATSATPCPRGVRRAVLQRRLRRHLRHHLRLHRRRLHPARAARLRRGRRARGCCSVPDVSKIELLGAQDEQIFVEFSTEQLAGLGLDYGALVAALQAQNVVRPAGVDPDRRRAHRRCGSRGAFDSEQDILDVNFVAGGRMIRLGDIADGAARLRRSAAADVPRQRQAGDRPRRSRCATAATSWRSARTSTRAMAAITADLPLGIEPILVADQPVDRRQPPSASSSTRCGRRSRSSSSCSFVSLGVRPGAVVALAIPLTLAIVFAIMQVVGIDLQRISLGALIIALALLVDDAMTTVDAMMPPARRPATPMEKAATLRLHDPRRADADRHAGHHRRLRADRLRRAARPASTPSRSSPWSASR